MGATEGGLRWMPGFFKMAMERENKLYSCLEEICQVCRQFVQCGSSSDTSAFFQVYSLKNSLVVSRGVLFRVADLMGNASHDPHGPLPTASLHSETWVDPGHIFGWAFMSFKGPQTLPKISLLTLTGEVWLATMWAIHLQPLSFVCLPSLCSSPRPGYIHVEARGRFLRLLLSSTYFPTYSLDTGSLMI